MAPQLSLDDMARWAREELAKGRRPQDIADDLRAGGWEDAEIAAILTSATSIDPVAVKEATPPVPPRARVAIGPTPGRWPDGQNAPRNEPGPVPWSGPARDWREVAFRADQAKKAYLADLDAGEEWFAALVRWHPRDGYPYLMRAEAREEAGRLEPAVDDYYQAQKLIVGEYWRARARQGYERVLDKLR